MKTAKEWNGYYKQQAHANILTLEAMCAEGVPHTNHDGETNLCPRCYASHYIREIYKIGLDAIEFCEKLAAMTQVEVEEARHAELTRQREEIEERFGFVRF